jgi:hypothetical protein
MKRIFFLFILIGNICYAQDYPNWQGEIYVGVSGYNGDLSIKLIDIKTWHPVIAGNIRYALTDLFAVRFGVSDAKISGNDKDNSKADFKNRNLNFQSNIFEGSVCGELNILSPDTYSVYPYVFAGVGFFHFNPYSFDNNNYKTYLQPLSTEGEGLSEYPGRKPYGLTQFCIPFGVGVKKRINSDLEIGFELAFHKIFTDYLDDVSKSYIDYNILLKDKGPEAAQMAFRQLSGAVPHPNYVRGNPKKDDTYYFAGIKLIYHFQD